MGSTTPSPTTSDMKWPLLVLVLLSMSAMMVLCQKRGPPETTPPPPPSTDGREGAFAAADRPATCGSFVEGQQKFRQKRQTTYLWVFVWGSGWRYFSYEQCWVVHNAGWASSPPGCFNTQGCTWIWYNFTWGCVNQCCCPGI